MGQIVGIDLGTTYSAIARINQLGRPEIIANRDGESLTPSVVQFQAGGLLVGSMAKRSAAIAPLDTVEFVKRAMGDPTWRFETSGGTTFRPEEISAIILRRLKEDAELFLGEPVQEAVITVPAYFDDGARRATQDAGTVAGLSVLRVLNEPTAAALAYGLERPWDGTVLIYDLGGGTFDVTIMRVAGNHFETLATNGDRNLGGFDWDNHLMALLNDRFQEAGGCDLLDDSSLEADLRERAESAKRALTTIPVTRVVLSADGVTSVIEVTRADFEDITSSLLSRTRDIAEIVVEDAGLRWDDVDRLLLAGGSTHMPAVRAMIEQASGLTSDRSTNPDLVVALGAAVQAGLLAREADRDAAPSITINGRPLTVSDVTSQGLGVLARDPLTKQMKNSVIIPPNTRIPAKSSKLFETSVDGQTALHIQVTQGDDEDPAYVKMIGEQGLTIPPYPAGALIDVAFAYDIDQTVFIEVGDVTAGGSLGSFEVYDVANMDDREKAAAKHKLDRLEIG